MEVKRRSKQQIAEPKLREQGHLHPQQHQQAIQAHEDPTRRNVNDERGGNKEIIRTILMTGATSILDELYDCSVPITCLQHD